MKRKGSKGRKPAECPQSIIRGAPRPFLLFCPAKRKELKRSPKNTLQGRKKRHQRKANKNPKEGTPR